MSERAPVRWYITGAYALLVGFCLFSMGEPIDLFFILVASGVIVWTVVPLLAFCFGKQQYGARLLGQVLVALPGALSYVSLAFVFQRTAFDLLFFLIIPFWQLIFSLAWLTGIWIWSRFFKERST